MAKKFSIQQAPTFKADVSLPRVGGDVMVVPFTFRFLDRVELAKVIDGWNQQEKELVEAAQGKSVEEATQLEVDMQVGQIQQVVVGWGFDDEFNEDSIRALALTSVNAPAAVLSAYHQAYRPAKSGN